MLMAKRGLYSNIHAKRKRIAAGSGEKMRKPGAKGAPTSAAFKQSEKTAMKKGGKVTKKLSDKQKKLLKLHSKPHKTPEGKKVDGHSSKHMKAMKVMMEHGMSFSNSHKATMKIIGK